MSYIWSRNVHQRDKNEEELIWVLNVHGVHSSKIMGQSGECDLLCATAEGLVFMLEVKSRNGKLSRKQEQWMESFPGPAYVIRKDEDIPEILERVRLHYQSAITLQ